MKIIVEKSTNDVLFMGDDLSLSEKGIKGNGFTASNLKPDTVDLIEIEAEIPKLFIGRFFEYKDKALSLKKNQEEDYKRKESPIPDAVSIRRFRLALIDLEYIEGLRTAIEGLSGKQKEIMKTNWQYSTAFKRDSKLITQIIQALGLTEEQMDAVFLRAMDSDFN